MTAMRVFTRPPPAIAARRSSAVDLVPGRHLARRLDQDERHLAARPLLVARDVLEDVVDRGPLEPRRQAARGEQARHLLAQRIAPREPQRCEQADRDRLAVAVAPVAGGRLDRVPDRVAEVQHLAPAAVALVLGHDRELRAQAAPDRLVVDRPALAHARPQRAAGDQRGLDDLGVARGRLLRRTASRALTGRRAPRRAGGTRRRSSSPPAGRRPSCRRRPSPPGRRASSGSRPSACRAGRRTRRTRPGRPPRRRRPRRRRRRAPRPTTARKRSTSCARASVFSSSPGGTASCASPRSGWSACDVLVRHDEAAAVRWMEEARSPASPRPKNTG